MSEEIRELTAEEKAAKEALDQKLAKCETEEEAYETVMRELKLDPNTEELGEADLELVVGGKLSNAQALVIVTKAYSDLCIHKKKTTIYSKKEINEAVAVCDKSFSTRVAASVMILGLGALNMFK